MNLNAIRLQTFTLITFNKKLNWTGADKPAQRVQRPLWHPTWIIRYVRHGFLLVCYIKFVPKTHRFLDIRIQNAVTLIIWLGSVKSLEMSPFDIPHMTSYWRSIVAMALYRVFSKILNVDYGDLEIPVKGQSRSLKVVPFHRLVMVSN